MSAPDRISICPDFPEYQWSDGETIPPKEWPVYLRLDGPTLNAVREALREWDASYNGLNGLHTTTQEVVECINKLTAAEAKLRAALKLLEGE